MFGMFAVYASIAISEQKENIRFEDLVRHLDPKKRADLIAERNAYKTEERRHRELCQSIRDSKPDRPYFF